MEKFVITGGKPLHGEVTISGAKNAAVGILPATILAADVCVIENLPDISDVSVSLKILSTLGAQVKMLNRNTYEIDTRHLVTTNVPDDLSRQMRASYYFLGALLSRFGKAQVAMPGGCNLGPRPIDQHLKVFSALGAEDSVDYGMITVRTKQELTGAHIFFDKFPGAFLLCKPTSQPTFWAKAIYTPLTIPLYSSSRNCTALGQPVSG